jgi:hypothetical protein
MLKTLSKGVAAAALLAAILACRAAGWAQEAPRKPLRNPFRQTASNRSIPVRVLVLNYDPFVPSEGNRRLHAVFGWNDPRVLARRYQETLELASAGAARFRIVEWRDLNEIYAQKDGYRYAPDEYVRLRRAGKGWHEGGGQDYPRLLREQGVPALIDAPAGDPRGIDEVWIFGDHFFGLWEASMAGPGAFFINGGVYPEVPTRRPFAFYGFNYERGVAEMLHNTCHRTEATLNRVFGEWNLKAPRNDWELFSANESQSAGLAGVGTCHWPANAEKDYDYGNPRVVQSWAEEFLNYPDLKCRDRKSRTKPVSRDTWALPVDGKTDFHTRYMQWYFTLLPRAPGTGPDGRQNNWWKYIYDFASYSDDGKRRTAAPVGQPGSHITGASQTAPVAYCDLVQLRASFDTNPGWEAVNNRVVATGGPVIRQEFGWSRTAHTGAPGEIGGTVWRSRTPAYYAQKLDPPLTMETPLSASGKIAVSPIAQAVGGAYFGFFNSQRQEWRPWSSMAVRVGDTGGGGNLTPLLTYDYMTSGWKAGGYDTVPIPADGSVHTWCMAWEPNAVVPSEWADPKLRGYLDPERRTPPEEILERARAQEPGLTKEALAGRLNAAENLGLVTFHTRRGIGWEIRREPEKVRGRMSFQLDGRATVSNFVDVTHRAESATYDRFGIFNMQLPGQPMKLHLGDLTVNGKRIDLSKDPGWDSKGSRARFVENDFHARQDFGWSKTRFAGGRRGEIGGTFWRTEPVDPLHGYYADDVGKLTLDDPVRFSGKIAFTGGATDAGMFFGYFNKKERMVNLSGRDESGAPLPQTMGFAIDGPTRIGYFFSTEFAPTRPLVSHGQGPVFIPDGRPRAFTFSYDPKANNGGGQIVFTLDDRTFCHDLTREQHAAGATFDRFGLMNIRRGGKYVTVYLDDLSYTARRPPGEAPERHRQTIVRVPYPERGRKY